ncbi:hypothetical protein D9757_010799 [Collybiopsis confluens]|uniref:Reverse transcriptase domain-containing protein n=1 Tax=Collybiopsis confluens TaxID=2823264 RepID=A0A8H5GU33_9AGAR|nr:hypothetical protein D9757_010799 [Collybiopsis confluens]
MASAGTIGLIGRVGDDEDHSTDTPAGCHHASNDARHWTLCRPSRKLFMDDSFIGLKLLSLRKANRRDTVPMFNAHQFNYVPHRPAIVVPALPRFGTDSFVAMREGQQTLQGVIDEFKNGRYTADTAREVIRQYTRALFSNFQTGQSWQDAITPWIDAVDDHARRISNAGHEGATRTGVAGATANGGPPPIPHQSRPQTFPSGTNQPGGATQVTPRQWRDVVGLPDSNPRPSVAPVQTQGNITAAGQRRSRAGSPADEDEETASDEDEDTSKRPYKRRKQDESTFGWAADAFIQQSLLSAKHLSIRSQVENYELDLDTAINNLLRSGCNPIFPKKQWRAVLQDQYINLSEVFAHISALHKSDSTPTSSSKLAEALELTTLVKRAPSKDVADGDRPGAPPLTPSSSHSQTDTRKWSNTSNTSSSSLMTTSPRFTPTSSSTTLRSDNSSEREATCCTKTSSMQHVGVSSHSTLPLPASCSLPKKGEAGPTRASGPKTKPAKYAETSTGGSVTLTDVNVDTFAWNAKNPATRQANVPERRMSLADQLRNERETATEPTPSRSLVSRFWNAAMSCAAGDTAGGAGEEPSTSFLPRFMRGFGFRPDERPLSSRTAAFTEFDDPLPQPPEEEFNGVAWQTIQNHPHLFHVDTPISAERLNSLLGDHPNKPFVASVICSLKNGFWPWANTQPAEGYPETWDNSWAPLPSKKERDFIESQCELEAEEHRHSPPFGPDLLPGMYSTPVFAVPKPHSDALRLVAHQSAGNFCQNSMVDKNQTKGARMDSLLVFIPMILAFSRAHPGKKLVLWKSDIANAFRLVPMHPLWQIKQVVTTGMPTKEEFSSGSWDESSKRRYVDWRACFGNSGSPRAWVSVMGLVVWIAIFVLHIIFLGCYVDDAFGVAEEGDTEVYEPYATSMPTDQARFLRLLDYLGLSHRRAKQLSGEILTVIGFLLDPNRLTATLPSESKDELVRQVRSFANSRRRTLHEWQQMAGWMNWSFNVYPLMRPALSNVYEKMSGKSNPSAQIFVNKAVTTDLLWFAEHVERSSGMFFFANLDWNPSTESDLIIYGDACLDGLGFWVPSRNHQSTSSHNITLTYE